MAETPQMKYIVVTGGTVSGLGKGITISRYERCMLLPAFTQSHASGLF